ncbi:MAG: hypothetical protein ACOYJB_03695 [Christensenellaceae bacterium]|jgi:hypothetical protein
MSTVEYLRMQAELVQAGVPVQDADTSGAFAKKMKEMSNRLAAEMRRAQSNTQAAAEAAAKKARAQRINELYAIIAQLRTRLMSGGKYNKTIAAQISVLQSELLWLIFGM